MSANPKTYSRKDGAVAALVKAGFKTEECLVKQHSGSSRWLWSPLSKPEPEASEPATVCVMPSDTCYLVSSDGGSFGMIAADRATKMAQDLANSEGVTIEVRALAEDGEIVATLSPVPSILETPETPALHVPEAMAGAFGFDADSSLVKDGLVVIEPQQAAQDADVAAPIVFPPGHGINAKGEIVPFPEVAEGSFKATLEKSWTTEPVKQEKLAKKERAIVPPAPVAQPEPALAPLDPGGAYILCVEGYPTSSTELWAREIAAKLKLNVVIRDADTFEPLRTMLPQSKSALRKAVKANKPTSERKPRGSLTGLNADILERACRPEGVSRVELTAMNSGVCIPWKSRLQGVARTRGYDVQASKVDDPTKRVVYRFVAAA